MKTQMLYHRATLAKANLSIHRGSNAILTYCTTYCTSLENLTSVKHKPGLHVLACVSERLKTAATRSTLNISCTAMLISSLKL